MIIIISTANSIKPPNSFGSPLAEAESLWIHKVADTNHFRLTIYSQVIL